MSNTFHRAPAAGHLHLAVLALVGSIFGVLSGVGFLGLGAVAVGAGAGTPGGFGIAVAAPT